MQIIFGVRPNWMWVLAAVLVGLALVILAIFFITALLVAAPLLVIAYFVWRYRVQRAMRKRQPNVIDVEFDADERRKSP